MHVCAREKECAPGMLLDYHFSSILFILTGFCYAIYLPDRVASCLVGIFVWCVMSTTSENDKESWLNLAKGTLVLLTASTCLHPSQPVSMLLLIICLECIDRIQ